MVNMKISIIIPAYNVEKYIENCLDSVIKDKNIEIIVVNDGSIDKTQELVEKYENVILFNNTNHGVSYSRNFGISKATGDYIMFVDSDDYLKNNWIDIVLNKKFNEDVIYFSNKLKSVKDKNKLLDFVIGVKKPCIAGPYCKLFKRDFLNENNIRFKEDIINGEDMLFNVECVLKLKNFKIINESIYMYRQNATSATKTYNCKILDSDKKFHVYLDSLLDTIEYDFKYYLTQFSKQNAIITLIDRMSYLKDYRDFKKKVSFLKCEPYKSALKYVDGNISKRSRLLIWLMKLKMYRLGYTLLKIKHKNSGISVENEYFIEI